MYRCNKCGSPIPEETVDNRDELYKLLFDGIELCDKCRDEYFQKVEEEMIKHIEETYAESLCVPSNISTRTYNINVESPRRDDCLNFLKRIKNPKTL